MSRSRELAALWDHQLRLQASRFSTRSAEWTLETGRALDALFHRLVDLAQPALFLEAGAHDARTSIGVKERNPDTTVIAFEANPRVFERTRRTSDPTARGVDYRNLALSRSAGRIQFHVEVPNGSLDNDGSSSILPRNRSGEVWAPDTEANVVEVDGRPLDDEVAGHEGRVAMWVDVEGAAGEVLGGAPATLARCDVMKIEVEDTPYWDGQALSLDILEMLLEAGMVPLVRDVEYDVQYNVVLASPAFARTPQVLGLVDAFLRNAPHIGAGPAPPHRRLSRRLRRSFG